MNQNSSQDSYLLYNKYSAWAEHVHFFLSLKAEWQANQELNKMEAMDLSISASSKKSPPPRSPETPESSESSESPESPESSESPESLTQASSFRLPCRGCERIFVSKKRLQNHLIECEKPKVEEVNPVLCETCGEQFKTTVTLLRHKSWSHSATPESLRREHVKTAKRSIFHDIDELAQSDKKYKKSDENCFVD